MYAVTDADDLPELDSAVSPLARLGLCNGSSVKLRQTISSCDWLQLPPFAYAALSVHAVSSSGHMSMKIRRVLFGAAESC